MINSRDYKSYIPFAIVCLLFLITAVASVIIYLKYNESPQTIQKNSEPISLEIKLPVIQWGKYEGLSKKYSNDTLK